MGLARVVHWKAGKPMLTASPAERRGTHTPVVRAPETSPIEAYYGDAHVRARIVEYCGATLGRRPTAAYLTALGLAGRGSAPYDPARSLWDLENLLFFLQLDYENADHPEEPFVHPADVLLKLESAYRACRAVFGSFGLDVQAILTGRGYHFVGRVPVDALVVDALASLSGTTPAWHSGVAARRPRGLSATMTERHARAAEGLGLLIEHAAHLILARAWTSPTPFVFNGATIRDGDGRRECVSIDFSHLGDPLDVVRIRTAFSAYRRHQQRADLFGPAAASLPPLVALPRDRQSLVTFLTDGRGLDVGRQAARETHAFVPDVTRGIAELLCDYLRSPLAEFHRRFRADCRVANLLPDWRSEDLPLCVAAPLEAPGKLLRTRGRVQQVVRALLGKGWTAAQIAALIEQKYDEAQASSERSPRFDPRSRAEFAVRVFAGLVATGADS
jgi:hypothetical protein